MWHDFTTEIQNEEEDRYDGMIAYLGAAFVALALLVIAFLIHKAAS